LNKFSSKEIHDIHPNVMEAFAKYSWPGNIRELENLMERAYIIETSSVLTPESFPSELFTCEAPTARVPVNSSLTLAEVRCQGIDDTERQYLKELLTRNRGKVK